MKEMTFATGNNGKVASLRRSLKSHGVNIEIIQKPLDLLEPQADTAVEVAKVKAAQAYKQLQCPVLVDDSSFHISALGGFPGPYIKYMLTTIGAEGIVEFMEGKTDRRAYFTSSLVFIDENGEPQVFEGAPYRGIITEEIDDYDRNDAWSDLYKIFVPDGSDKVLARMTSEDHAKNDKQQGSGYGQFAKWLKERYEGNK